MATVHDLAAFILSRRGQMGGMKLQKLVYYCQAWSTVWDDAPIFGETTYAWKHGPVVRDLWEQHKRAPFVTSLPVGDAAAIDANHHRTIDAVLAYYGERDHRWLSALTHVETPWADADHNQVISCDEMKAYYSRYTTPRHEISVELARGLSLLVSLPADLRDDVLDGLAHASADGIEEWLETGAGDPWQTSDA
jgi:uncharacterized phage-associated protein